jgi:UDP-N-acetylglucosamine 2-epimerase (non-hydrolysing)
MKVLSVVGARPNFMKVAPVHRALQAAGAEARLLHTGQHYDQNMSQVFFEQLRMPRPDVDLEVGSGSHAQQTARIMERFEPLVLDEKPDWVLVAGDVNSTIACALVAVKLGVPVAHLEAGLRSFDRRMPEEINRILTDRISAMLLTPSPDADENLLAEGCPRQSIYRVGNAMIDTLNEHIVQARQLGILERLGLFEGGYGLVTMHRPSNVDDAERLGGYVDALLTIAQDVPLVFPVHPRTKSRLVSFSLWERLRGTSILLLEPTGYLEFLALQASARLVITDSGGIQEESTCLGVPCLTVRENTERPITIEEGTNTLVGVDPLRLVEAAREVVSGGGKAGRIPALWDGGAGKRVAALLVGA